MKNNWKIPNTVGGSTEVGPTGSTNAATGTSWVWLLQSSLHVIDRNDTGEYLVYTCTCK